MLKPSGEKKTVNSFEKQKILDLLFSNILTLNLYIPLVWFKRIKRTSDALGIQTKLSFNTINQLALFIAMPLFMLILNILMIIWRGFGFDYFLTRIFITFFGIVASVLLLILSFRARSTLMNHYRANISAVGTFFFTVYYLQYKINRL